MSDLEGRVALVTGASRGIGAATARALAAAGARVILTDLSDASTLAAQLGGQYLRHDVTSESGWAEAMTFVQAKPAGSTSWSTTPACSCRNRCWKPRWKTGDGCMR